MANTRKQYGDNVGDDWGDLDYIPRGQADVTIYKNTQHRTGTLHLPRTPGNRGNVSDQILTPNFVGLTVTDRSEAIERVHEVRNRVFGNTAIEVSQADVGAVPEKEATNTQQQLF